MKPEDILLLGVKHSVLAFKKETGAHLWATALKTGLSADFVSLISDEKYVFAHTGGELHCLDLFTGEIRWHDKLPGFGFGIVTFALPGKPASSLEPSFLNLQARAAAAQEGTHVSSAPPT